MQHGTAGDFETKLPRIYQLDAHSTFSGCGRLCINHREYRFSLGFQQPGRGLKPVASVFSADYWCAEKAYGIQPFIDLLVPFLCVNLEDEVLVKSGERMDFPFVSMGWEVIEQDLGMIITANLRFRQDCIYQHVRNVNTTTRCGGCPCVAQSGNYGVNLQ